MESVRNSILISLVFYNSIMQKDPDESEYDVYKKLTSLNPMLVSGFLESLSTENDRCLDTSCYISF